MNSALNVAVSDDPLSHSASPAGSHSIGSHSGSVDLDLSPLPATYTQPSSRNTPTNSPLTAGQPPSKGKTVGLNEAEKATRNAAKELRERREEKFALELKAAVGRFETDLQAIAEKYGKSEDRVRQLLNLSSHYGRRRTPRLDNAILHHMKSKYNDKRPKGTKYSPEELREMAKTELYLQDVESNEDKQRELLDEIIDQRQSKAAGAHITERSQAAMISEAQKQTSDIMRRLFYRTDAPSFGLVSKPNIMEYGVPGFYAYGDAADFIQETFGMNMWKLTRKFELWATNNSGKLSSPHRCTASNCVLLITSGLKNLRGNNTQMNWVNYDAAIVVKLRCRMVGWPEGVDFSSPSAMTNCEHLMQLLDALKSGVCYWHCMSTKQVHAHKDWLEKEQKAGRKEPKKRAPRADKGKTRGQYKPRKAASSDTPVDNLAETSPSSTSNATGMDAPVDSYPEPSPSSTSNTASSDAPISNLTEASPLPTSNVSSIHCIDSSPSPDVATTPAATATPTDAHTCHTPNSPANAIVDSKTPSTPSNVLSPSTDVTAMKQKRKEEYEPGRKKRQKKNSTSEPESSQPRRRGRPRKNTHRANAETPPSSEPIAPFVPAPALPRMTMAPIETSHFAFAMPFPKPPHNLENPSLLLVNDGSSIKATEAVGNILQLSHRVPEAKEPFADVSLGLAANHDPTDNVASMDRASFSNNGQNSMFTEQELQDLMVWSMGEGEVYSTNANYTESSLTAMLY
ncbi:hypothetical protein E1B28_006328 [Marasmius oreades]|uniref:Uncharacterized protein n=1 Tax=Marasmius oreades TaxID=181124 RepID=A0A9P7UVG9_9AGAR|nr:uncharacterized protein E1B28_006328 [Marasmius oreades]KAG7095598.1 hypothetical protein E1B28_006328 [Marasmius oreades]